MEMCLIWLLSFLAFWPLSSWSLGFLAFGLWLFCFLDFWWLLLAFGFVALLVVAFVALAFRILSIISNTPASPAFRFCFFFFIFIFGLWLLTAHVSVNRKVAPPPQPPRFLVGPLFGFVMISKGKPKTLKEPQ